MGRIRSVEQRVCSRGVRRWREEEVARERAEVVGRGLSEEEGRCRGV